MFDDIHHWQKLRKYQKDQAASRKKYDVLIRQASKAGKTVDDIMAIRHEALFENDLHEDAIETLQSRHLINKARR